MAICTHFKRFHEEVFVKNFFLLSVIVASTLTATFWDGEAMAAPYYRFWRGFKRSDMSSHEFKSELAKHFMPATVEINKGKGLLSYLVTIPPRSHAGIPDELALVRYESEEAYKRQRATPEGQAYGEMHWEVFEKEISKSLVPSVYQAGELLKLETAYDMLGKEVDWQKGYSTVYIGLRKSTIEREDFIDGIRKHVVDVTNALKSQGLQGYIVLMTSEYEIAYMNWPSQAVATSAFESKEAKAFIKDAQLILSPLQYSEAKNFDGTADDNQFINVRF